MALPKELKLAPTTPDAILPRLATDMVLNAYTHGEDPEMDQRVADAYTTLTGNKFMAGALVGGVKKAVRPTPRALYGPPGHGKSSVFKQASQLAAQALGMDWVEADKQAPDYVPASNDFLYIVREMAGQISGAYITGTPKSREDADGEAYMGTLPERAFLMARKARASFLIFDDAGNAARHLVPIMLGILQDRRYGPNHLGDKITIGLTTNVKGDGSSAINDLGTAVGNRVKNFFTRDTVDDWIKRYTKNLAAMDPEVTDTGFEGFIRLHGEDIFDDEKYKDEVRSTPRSLMNLGLEMPRILLESTHGAFFEDDFRGNPSIEYIKNEAASLVGHTVAERLGGYYYSLMTGALPLARRVMQGTSKPQEIQTARKKVQERFKSGHNANEVDFGTQYVMACADIAVRNVLEVARQASSQANPNGINEKVTEQVAKETTRLANTLFQDIPHGAVLMNGWHHFTDKLNNTLPAPYVEATADSKGNQANPTTWIRDEVISAITKGVNEGELKGVPDDLRPEFKDTISGYGAFRSYSADDSPDTAGATEETAEAAPGAS